MPNLTQYKQFKNNPALSLFQELERMKEELRLQIQIMQAKIDTKLIGVDQIKIKEVELSTTKLAEQIAKNLLGDFKGIKGDIGERGEKGDTVVGEQGERGLQGIQGLQGVQGKQGLIGLRGEIGKNGIDGKDAIFPMQEFTTFKKEIEELLKEELKKLKKSKQFRAGGISRGGGLDTRKVIFDELVGTGDGATTVYTLDYTPDTNISNVGISVGTARLHITEDFTRSGRTLTFLIAPPSGHKIYADYIRE